MQVADQRSAIGANTGETPTREMRHNPVSVHERPSYSRNFKDLREMISQVRIHISQPASLLSRGPISGLGPNARKTPPFSAFCAERGRARDRERPIIERERGLSALFSLSPVFVVTRRRLMAGESHDDAAWFWRIGVTFVVWLP